MHKYLQNKISGSQLTLPVTTIYALVVWVMAGVIQEQWWWQLGCFSITAYLMMLLNNEYSLIRVYSRFISVFFLVLTCSDCHLFASIPEAISSLFLVLTYFILFNSYQDKTKTGIILYAFASYGIACLSNVHLLYYVPLFWLFMKYNLLVLTWRTWLASVLGLLLPYWFAECWYIYREAPWALFDYLQPLAEFAPIADYTILSAGQIFFYLLLVTLGIMGSVHFLHKSYFDSIRVRLLYSIFIWTDLITAVFLALQPQHYDLLIRLMIINTSPLVAHFLALTSTKITNAVFHVIVITIVTLTIYHLWTIS